jgi:hypothetical protein
VEASCCWACQQSGSMPRLINIDNQEDT